MALATEIGTEVQRPLAAVVTAGLITTTIVALFCCPPSLASFCLRQGAAQVHADGFGIPFFSPIGPGLRARRDRHVLEDCLTSSIGSAKRHEEKMKKSTAPRLS
jgi:hypothetical protein